MGWAAHLSPAGAHKGQQKASSWCPCWTAPCPPEPRGWVTPWGEHSIGQSQAWGPWLSAREATLGQRKVRHSSVARMHALFLCFPDRSTAIRCSLFPVSLTENQLNPAPTSKHGDPSLGPEGQAGRKTDNPSTPSPKNIPPK